MTTIPEGAQLSEDGNYQWDGADWQPVGQEGLVLHDLDAYPTIQAWAYVEPTEDAAKDYFAQLGLDEAAATGEAIA